MTARPHLWIALVALGVAGCGPTSTKPSSVAGLWNVDLGKAPTAVQQALWEDGKLRLKPDGTFIAYAPITMEGKWSQQGQRVTLTPTQILEQDVEFIKSQVDAHPLLKGLPIDMPIGMSVTAGGKRLVHESINPGYDGVAWTIAPRDSTKALLDLWAFGDIENQEPEMHYAYDEIGLRGDEAVPVLAKALLDTKGKRMLRMSACTMLAVTKSPRAVDPLIQVVRRNDDRRVTSTAIRALGDLQAKEAVQPILEAVAGDDRLAFNAAKALGRIGDKTAVPALIKLLNKPRLGTDSELDRATIIEALGLLGDPAAVPAIKQFERSEDPELVSAVTIALAKLSPERDQSSSIPKLLKAAKSQDWMARIDAVKALGEVGGPEAIPVLIAALEDIHPVNREAAVALGKLKAKAAVTKLKALATSSRHRDVREAAVEALKQIG